MDETRKLAQFVKEIDYNDMDEKVIEKAKGLVLDQFGCQLAFSTLPWSKAVYKYVKSRKGGTEDSTVVNYGLRTTPEDAALANVSFGYGFEMDDYDFSCHTHPGCVVVPSALAIGEMEMINGKEFLAAIVVGYEVMLRIATATHDMFRRWFFPTSVTGPFGAAAVTSRALQLDLDATLNALSIAAFQSGGLGEWSETGGSVVHAQTALAAHSGIRAAFLAQGGLTGPPTALEGKKGFSQAYAEKYFLNEITEGLGKQYRILSIGTKAHCCCGAIHPAIDAVSKILKEHPIIPEDIEEVTVGQKRLDVASTGSITEPEDISGAQFSLRFGVALRIVKGGNQFKDYTEENIRDPKVLSIARKINHVFDEEMENAKTPAYAVPAKVTIKLKNGTIYKERIDCAKGPVGNPMTKDDIENKFRGLASVVLPDDQVEKVIQTVWGLDKLDNVNKLGSLLTTRGCK